jgi:hypothetical protein
MSKKWWFITLLTPLVTLAHDHVPYPKTHNAQSLDVIFLKTINNFQPKLQIENGKRYNNTAHSKMLFGSYWKYTKTSRIGVFYSETRGLRHSEDWVFQSDDWFWLDTSQRKEYLIDLVHTNRWRHLGLPLLYNFNTTYQINNSQGHSTLIAKPGIHYFFKDEGLIKYSIKLDIPLYFALNYDNENLYKKGLYLSLNYHYSKPVTVSFFTDYLEETWVASSDALDSIPNDKYEKTDKVNLFGIKLIFNF